jgi:hypothetical protein
METDDEEWNKTQMQFRAIGERLLLAGWATRVVDTDKGVAISLTEKGTERMDNLSNALRELNPHSFNPDHFMGLLLYLTLREDGPDSATSG